jgi:S-DNA-T family DNA segregation ATPase FtsK/SpoIIIE
MFRDRAHTLIEGQADEDAEAACAMLEEAVAEMARRYDPKRAAGIRGNITREMSRRKGSGFHPIYVVVNECQVMYMAPHPIGGSKDDARAWRAAKRLHDQARAVNIHLPQGTQRPDDRTVPVRVREGAHNRCSLYVPNYQAAKMVLADAADRGARPYDLRPGADAGTVVATGEFEDIPRGQAFAIVRTHYVDTTTAYKVMQRADAIGEASGWTDTPTVVEADEPIDHLADIRRALRDEPRVRTQVILGRLAEHDPDAYEEWTFGDLRAALAEHDVDVAKSGGYKVVRLEDVDQALTARAAVLPELDTIDTAG